MSYTFLIEINWAWPYHFIVLFHFAHEINNGAKTYNHVVGARDVDTSATAGVRRHRQQRMFFGAKRCLEGEKSSQENSWKKLGTKK